MPDNKINDLQVYKVRQPKESNNFKHLHSNILHPPFVIIMVAPPRTGKSNLIVNMIYNNYEKSFDNIIYISPNVYNDNTLAENVAKDENIMKIDDISDLNSTLEAIIKIMKDQRTSHDEDDKKKHTLLILDDCLGELRKGKQLQKLLSKYRHYHISVIITTQGFKAVDNICRSCATGYIIFKNGNNKELKMMNDEFSGSFPNFMVLYEEATRKKYHFLFLDFRNVQAYENFDTPISVADDYREIKGLNF